MRAAEYDVRNRADALEEGLTDHAHTDEAARELVLASTLPLEITLFECCIVETAAARGIRVYRELRDTDWDEVRRCMRTPNLGAILDEHWPTIVERLGLTTAELEAAQDQPIIPRSTVARQAEALVAACPIETIERAAAIVGLIEHGHRCRVAFDGLRAFLRRARPGVVDEVGKAYASGKLSISQSARILEVSPADALVEFEARGHCRSPETLILSPDEEAAIFRALREDRERRGGEPELVDAHVARAAIASERIEGVDARQWLRTRRR